MHHRFLALLATAAGLAAVLPAQAYDYTDTPPREQRMEEALRNYRGTDPRNPQPGPAARAEESIKEGAHDAGAAVKRGAHRTGEAIKHGARRAGHAIGTGMEKTGDAIRRGGDKLKDKISD
ncbi:hypothetical protein [Pseudorhodoferax sp.]|uniref:hypothetical protein n=1 Tax=Pseudorhodoferax sp. TaxID=1993553 RepID=UPI0039E35219